MSQKTINLGFKAPDYSGSGQITGVQAPTSIAEVMCYPEMTIPGNKGLARALQVGQEFTALVKFRVSEILIRDRDDDRQDPFDCFGGTHVDLQARSISFEGINVDESEGETSGAQAFAAFLGKKPAGGKSGEDDGIWQK